MSLATKLGVSPSSEMTPEARRETDRLQKLTGPEFDRAFSRLMIQDHEKDISEFKKEAASGQGSVQQFAAQSLPVLEKHLQMAKSPNPRSKRARGGRRSFAIRPPGWPAGLRAPRSARETSATLGPAATAGG